MGFFSITNLRLKSRFFFQGSHNSHERRNSAFVRAVSKVKTINKFRVKRSVSDFGLPKKEDGHLHPLISSERDKWLVNIIYRSYSRLFYEDCLMSFSTSMYVYQECSYLGTTILSSEKWTRQAWQSSFNAILLVNVSKESIDHAQTQISISLWMELYVPVSTFKMIWQNYT